MNHGSSDRIANELRRWIEEAPPGTRLPSTRSLVAQHGASPVTVQKALRSLAAQGLVESRPGAGTFVRPVRRARPHDYGWQTTALGAAASGIAAQRPPEQADSAPHASAASSALRSAPAEAVALHAGYPDRELLPERLVRAALVRASRGEAAVSRPPSAGLPELRAWFASELGTAVPSGLTPPAASDAVVLPGSQSGLSAVFRALAGTGGPVLIESPTYWGAILAAQQTGVRLIPIAGGPHGPDPEELDRALARTGARVLYAQPSFANPTGALWSTDLAERVLKIVRRHRAFLVEDDWARDFAVSAETSPLAARDDAGHVVYLRSLTKSVSPAVRVAGLIARGPARERIAAEAEAQSMYVSGVLQAAALDVVTQPGWRTHLGGVRRQLAERRDLLVGALREHVPSAHLALVPHGGLNLWLQLPEAVDLHRLIRDCEERGVLLAGGDAWFPQEPAGRFLRLNYAGPNPGAFPEAARVLGRALEDQLG
ncbi:PLP-dependent aminotransferase family protein [Brevibacterium album]|uniref:aminotransferase-like domain-containing protein n=1 Tax=Brevibacterium album TaxID=417948 RepID=UPI00041BEF3F|nr:PLP-dependent aminotransferase family protein [Brevibacterium album]